MENMKPIRNRQPPVIRNDERRPSFSARNVQTYTITSFTDAHNSRQKIASIIKKPDGGGGGCKLSIPAASPILSAKYKQLTTSNDTKHTLTATNQANLKFKTTGADNPVCSNELTAGKPATQEVAL